MKLDPRDIEAIAARAAELVRREEAAGPPRLADAARVARMLGVERDWVYAHARRLGAVRLGGRHGRLRFDMRQIERELLEPAQRPPTRPRGGGRSRRAPPGRAVDLSRTESYRRDPFRAGRTAR